MENDITVKILEEIKKYPTLESFLGRDWFEEMSKTKRQKKHPLYHGLVEMNLGAQFHLSNIEDNLKVVLEILDKDEFKNDKIAGLKGKLKNEEEFSNILPELEWTTFLKKKGLDVVVEPNFPKEGPDLKIIVNDRIIYCEIKSLRFLKTEEMWSYFCNTIRTRIETIVSNLEISVTLNPSFSEGDLKSVIKLIKSKMEKYQMKNHSLPATVYFFQQSRIKELIEFDADDLSKNFDNDFAKCKCMMIFRQTEDYEDQTFVSVNPPVTTGDYVDKIRNSIAGSRRRQISKESPSIIIIIIDTSQIIEIAGDLCSALFGRIRYILCYDNKTGKRIDSSIEREKGGIFSLSTRISALVHYDRRFPDKTRIYRNPNAKFPLTDEEARLFGELMN